MKMYAFSLLDTKAGAFGVPFFVAHEAIARRMVHDLTNDPNTSVFRHPGDFSLYQVGEFDPSSGKLAATPIPAFIAACSEFAGKVPAIPPIPVGVSRETANGKEA